MGSVSSYPPRLTALEAKWHSCKYYFVNLAAHFGTQHTLQRYESAFYQPLLSTRDNFERWQESGAPDTARRANALWKKLLQTYEKPPIDPAIEEALADFVARRKREISASAHTA